MPNESIEIGRATSWRIGFINVFTTPIATAATTAVQRFASINPGTMYSTTSSAKTLIARRIINRINLL